MGTTFLIGNGFDLNCGLHSSFKDICEKYITMSENDTECIRSFKNSIKLDIDSWGNFEMQMAAYAHTIDDGQKYIDCLRDFRKHMEICLQNEVLNFTQNKLSKNYSKVLYYLGDFLKYDTYVFPSAMKSKLINIFSAKESLNVISFNYTDVFDFLLKEIDEEGLIKEYYGKIEKPVHIHGRLSPAGVKSNVTLGVDNVKQLEGVTFELTDEIKRTIIKPFFNMKSDPQKQKKVSDIIMESSVLCIYGMSLGDSDLSWKKIIKQWLMDLDTPHYLIWFDYSLSKMNIDMDQAIGREENARIEKLKHLGLNEIEIAACKDRIFIPIGQNLINIGDEFKKEKSHHFKSGSHIEMEIPKE